jgi:hypothetical protein
MSNEDEQPSTSDLVFQILHAQKEASFPASHRELHGPSETMFVATESLAAVNEILETALTLHAGIHALALERSMSLHLLKEGRNLTLALRRQLEKAATDGLKHQPAALQIIKDDFAPLNAMTLINLAAAIEVAVEQVAMCMLRFCPGAAIKLHDMGVKKTSIPEGRDLSYDEAQAVYVRLKQWAYGTEDQAPGALLRMLAAVGLPIDLPEQIQSDIREMIYIRNCILHRRHRADKNASKDAVALGLEDGHRFTVKRVQMGRYSAAATRLIHAIAQASLPKNLLT